MTEFAPVKLVRISEYTSPKYDFALLYEIDCIVDHVIKTLLIRKGSYVWDPEYGSNLLNYLFAPLDAATIESLKNEVESVAKSHPSVEKVNVVTNYDEQQKWISLNVTLIVSGVTKNFAIQANRVTRDVHIKHY